MCIIVKKVATQIVKLIPIFSDWVGSEKSSNRGNYENADQILFGNGRELQETAGAAPVENK